jgi:hypothetical protein
VYNGASLNDYLLVELKLEQDLLAIVAWWRQWHYVYTADRQNIPSNFDRTHGC